MTGSIEWPSPAPQLHIDDCFEIRNCHWGPCDLLLSSHQIFSTRYGFAKASSARGPCNFGPFTDLAISVFREMSTNTVFTQIYTSRRHRLWRWFMRRTGAWVSAFRNSIIHEIFSKFLQPIRVCRNLRGLSPRSKSGSSFLFWFWIFGWLGQQVSPFFRFNMFTWHSYWIGIYPTKVSPCSSLTVAWHNHGWWDRWAWGRHRMINLLPWRCHGCWRGKTGGRTRWQTRNHDRNQNLCVALYPNPVFNEMWFLTVDPFIRVSVFIAKLSERQYCWRVFEDFHCQE